MIGTAHHYSVTVSDVDESLEFYRDVLGLELDDRRTIEKGTEDSRKFSDFVGVDEDLEITIAFLDAGGADVELLEYDPVGTDANEGVANNDPGASHFCLEVDDIDRAYERIRADVEAVHDPVTLSKGTRVMYLYDPDGNVVELADRSGVDDD